MAEDAEIAENVFVFSAFSAPSGVTFIGQNERALNLLSKSLSGSKVNCI